jgi:hypothetical protein
VTTFRDRFGRFSIRYPTTWHRSDLEGKDGIRVAPSLNDPETWFTASVEPLDVQVVAEDLDTLKRGVVDGLAALTDCVVEEESDITLGNVIRFERLFTFRDNDVVRKRRIWLIYVDKWLILLAAQGSTPDEYAYWLSMTEYAFQTFELPEALWFATDPELAALNNPQVEDAPT